MENFVVCKLLFIFDYIKKQTITTKNQIMSLHSTTVKIEKITRLLTAKKTYNEMANASITKYLYYRTKGLFQLSHHYVELSNHYADRGYKMDKLIDKVIGA
tara:strand:- start:7273 stop:7575 length:303 start_codon:yes stop_codon:yes gene_type:complete